jgi:hypothetical protein
MKKGRASSGGLSGSPSQGGRRGGGWRAVLISLSPPRGGGHGRLEFAPVAHLLRDRQAARGSVAPLGAKGWSRVSMCQIASVSRRARSICATLAPRVCRCVLSSAGSGRGRRGRCRRGWRPRRAPNGDSAVPAWRAGRAVCSCSTPRVILNLRRSRSAICSRRSDGSEGWRSNRLSATARPWPPRSKPTPLTRRGSSSSTCARRYSPRPCARSVRVRAPQPSTATAV